MQIDSGVNGFGIASNETCSQISNFLILFIFKYPFSWYGLKHSFRFYVNCDAQCSLYE